MFSLAAPLMIEIHGITSGFFGASSQSDVTKYTRQTQHARPTRPLFSWKFPW